MKRKQAGNMCTRVFLLKEFFKQYYCLDEENEFKIWLQYHDDEATVDSFFDQMHKVMTDDFTPALAKLFAGEADLMHSLLEKDNNLMIFLKDHLIVLETFSEEWDKYINEEDTHIAITLSPDNDINKVLNNDAKKVIKFNNQDDKGNKD
jgi:hypothetical protein